MNVAAFFDMDRTLLRCNTGAQWIQFLLRRREISRWKALRAMSWVARYKLSILDMEAVTRIAVADMGGDHERPMAEKAQEFFHQVVVPSVAPLAIQAVEYHRARGHTLAILSSSTTYLTEPVAAHLRIEHVLCTRLHVAEGKFLGTHVAPACYGTGKVHWAEQFAQDNAIDLAQSWFYTDSYSDLPMLERVGIKRVINPDTRLRRHARRVGWEMQEW